MKDARRSPTESSKSYAETSPEPHYEIVEEASHNHCWQNAAVSLKHCDIVFMQLALEGQSHDKNGKCVRGSYCTVA